jgi:thymidine kinase
MVKPHPKFYEVKTICNDCGHHAVMEIPYGTPAREFLPNQTCDVCGNNNFHNISLCIGD